MACKRIECRRSCRPLEKSLMSSSVVACSGRAAPPLAVLESLAEHHETVTHHIALLRRCDLEPRIESFALLQDELLAHARLEEEELYPGLLLHQDTRDLAKRLYAQHAEIERRLDELRETPFSELIWFRRFNELVELLALHMREEEQCLFEDLPFMLYDRSAVAEARLSR
jgi:hypothetical protein